MLVGVMRDPDDENTVGLPTIGDTIDVCGHGLRLARGWSVERLVGDLLNTTTFDWNGRALQTAVLPVVPATGRGARPVCCPAPHRGAV